MLVFATNNAHKVQELTQILNGQFDIKTMREIGCDDDIPETADTLEGNAWLKAHYLHERYQCNCFSEDTGLEVNALGGEPGVHTARYAGEQRSAGDNIALLLNNLKDKPDRSAQFRTIIALILDGEEYVFEGICKGQIALEPKGTGGFGYDPVFIPDEYNETFAILGDDVKNQISHRARAVHQLRDFLVGRTNVAQV